jgi:hypothetical protein
MFGLSRSRQFGIQHLIAKITQAGRCIALNQKIGITPPRRRKENMTSTPENAKSQETGRKSKVNTGVQLSQNQWALHLKFESSVQPKESDCNDPVGRNR